MSIQTQLGMPIDDFIRAFDAAPFELIDGERIALVPTVAEHTETLKRLYALLLIYEQQGQTIVVYSESPFVLTDSPEWVRGARVPDVMVYRTERMVAYKAQLADWKKKPYILVPDLCVEVISPTDSYLEVEDKVDRYLSDGVQVIWVVNPRKNTVSVYMAHTNQVTRLGEDDTLTEESLLPGFAVKIAHIFE